MLQYIPTDKINRINENPAIILEKEGVKVWYKQVSWLKIEETMIHIQLYSPLSFSSAHDYTCVLLLEKYLEQMLADNFYNTNSLY